jgi:hypothetical protein
MSPTSYQAAPPRKQTIAEPRCLVKSPRKYWHSSLGSWPAARLITARPRRFRMEIGEAERRRSTLAQAAVLGSSYWRRFELPVVLDCNLVPSVSRGLLKPIM